MRSDCVVVLYVEDLSPAVPHDQQGIKEAKGDGRDHKQIHRGNAIGMIAQKRLPALRRRICPARHILGNAGLPDIDPELEQFAINARCTPTMGLPD